MYSNNKQIRDVANIAAQIMSGQQPVTEKLHPNQQQLDVHEPEKDELTADDFKKLRGKKEVKKEEVELTEEEYYQIGELLVNENIEIDEETMTHIQLKKAPGTSGNVTHVHYKGKQIGSITKNKPSGMVRDAQTGAVRKATLGGHPGANKISYSTKHKSGETSSGHGDVKNAVAAIRDAHADSQQEKRIRREEVETIHEVKLADLPSRKIQGRAYGASRPEPHAVDTIKGPNDAELKKIEAEKKKKKFSEMVNLYQDKGLKSLSEMLAKEEATEDEFNKEVEDAKDKAAGKKKQPDIAKGAVQAVKNEETHTTVEVIDLNDVNGVQYSEIELAQERTLTPAETDKKEEIVKSMKKGLSGFKERYGSRANDVMYATATARAKGE